MIISILGEKFYVYNTCFSLNSIYEETNWPKSKKKKSAIYVYDRENSAMGKSYPYHFTEARLMDGCGRCQITLLPAISSKAKPIVDVIIIFISIYSPTLCYFLIGFLRTCPIPIGRKITRSLM
jgi:hypothetical protein